jgi:hypothetical protein
MVSDHGCIRVFKEATALMKQGYLVDMITRQVTFAYNKFTTVTLWHDPEQLTNAVRSTRADIIHVHNEPDWMVAAARSVTDKPIVYDIHDLRSLNNISEPEEEELAAYASANAVVHVSQPCADYAEQFHGTPYPSIILPSYINEEFLPDTPGDVSWTAFCYEGGLSSQKEIVRDDPNGLQWYNLRYWVPFVQEFIKQGFTVDMYAAGDTKQIGTDYEEAGACVILNVHYPILLRALRPHAFGMVGGIRTFPLLEAALPNKLFEYISQGVVPVIFNAAEAARFVTEHGVGVVPEKGDSRPIAEQIVEPGKIARQNILEKRHLWTMENQIDKLMGLYEEIVR